MVGGYVVFEFYVGEVVGVEVFYDYVKVFGWCDLIFFVGLWDEGGIRVDVLVCG